MSDDPLSDEALGLNQPRPVQVFEAGSTSEVRIPCPICGQYHIVHPRTDWPDVVVLFHNRAAMIVRFTLQ